MARYHFSGIAGAGMNPLAQLMRAQGHTVQGSDRSIDQGKNTDVAERLRGAGIRIFPQDGHAISPLIDRFVYSTAVEADTPEMRAARALGLDLVPRPRLLAEIVNSGRPGVAIAGTSGKSTVTGMLGWLLSQAGRPATVLGGAGLVGEGGGGCFTAGPADGPVVAEACESDGTLVGYRPSIGLVHNISRDHGEIETLREQFSAFGANAARLIVNALHPEAARLGQRAGAVCFGAAASDCPLTVISVGPDRGRAVLRLPDGDLALDVPQPGLHNVENAAAASVVAREIGLDLDLIASAIRHFPGVARRYQVIGTTASGIRVVDDYAHNGDKIRAALTTAQAGAGRVVAVFQPHGFGPARFLRPELAELIPKLLRPSDRFGYAEIFYAGGTVAKDVSSETLAGDLRDRMPCAYAADHAAVHAWMVSEARPGDTVLIMGARDPELPRLARRVFESLDARPVPPRDR